MLRIDRLVCPRRGSFSLQRVGVTYGASMYAAYARIYTGRSRGGSFFE